MPTKSLRTHIVLVAAGRGTRFGRELGVAKQFTQIHGKMVLVWALEALLVPSVVDCLGKIVVVLPQDMMANTHSANTTQKATISTDGFYPHIHHISKALHASKALQNSRTPMPIVVAGGNTRAQSVAYGIHALRADDDDLIIVHDGARPYVPSADIDALMTTVHNHSVGAILGAQVVDSVKQIHARPISVARESLFLAKTPQAFYAKFLRQLDDDVTDEAGQVERLGLEYALVCGSHYNIKLTHAQDLAYLTYLLQ